MKKAAVTLIISTVCLVGTSHSANRVKLEDHVEGEILVKFKPNINKKDAFENFKKLDMYPQEMFHFVSGEYGLFNTPNKAELGQFIDILKDDPLVEYAEPNYRYQIIENHANYIDMLTQNLHAVRYSSITNDPLSSKLWGINNTGINEPASPRGGNSSRSGVKASDINAMKAWQLETGDRVIKIAVIDTGVDYTHEDLQANMWVNSAEENGTPGVDDDGNGYVDDIHGYDFANKDSDPMDDHGHGTHCSGTIAAEHDNGIGVAGVMKNAQIMGLKFLLAEGGGTVVGAIGAIDYAIKMKADILSNSWGGGGYSQALKDILTKAKDRGIIVTAAAGNSGTDNNYKPNYPASYDIENIISVAATNYNDGLASFSCYGSKTVHVAAPGRNILSTNLKNTYTVMSGTSMATPHVSGIVGLYLSLNGKTDPKVVKEKLIASSIYNETYGRKLISGGRVDAYNFLAEIETPKPDLPQESDWISYPVTAFESIHPYKDKEDIEKTYRVPNARYIRAVVKEYDIEDKYDYIRVLDGNRSQVEKIDGKGFDYHSEYVDGESITLRFTSDLSATKWGFLIEELEYVP
jgi:subtilisin family serine protease